jgi:hypothetical protein
MGGLLGVLVLLERQVPEPDVQQTFMFASGTDVKETFRYMNR